jgi:hypothetical protein
MSSEWGVEDALASEANPQDSTPFPVINNEPLELNLVPFMEDYVPLESLFNQFSTKHM